MARTPKRLYGPTALTAAAATKYTVPALTKTVIRHIHVENTSAGAVTFTMSIGADAAGTRLFDAYSIAAGAVFDWYPYMIMDAAEILQALASNTVPVLTIFGDELTLG
jgi:hypothetical protein